MSGPAIPGACNGSTAASRIAHVSGGKGRASAVRKAMSPWPSDRWRRRGGSASRADGSRPREFLYRGHPKANLWMQQPTGWGKPDPERAAADRSQSVHNAQSDQRLSKLCCQPAVTAMPSEGAT
jgi:hypothetical protein